MSTPGFGVMIGMLGGNADTVAAHQKAMNKEIASITIEDKVLTLIFSDGSVLTAHDDGQSCCERRYMVCDDDINPFIGATFTGMEIREAPGIADEWGEVHEVEFLEVHTSGGSFTIANHNEHNGYYGGFWIVLQFNDAEQAEA